MTPPMVKIVSWMYAPDGRFGADPLARQGRASEEGPRGRGGGAIQAIQSRDGEMGELGAYHYARIYSPPPPPLLMTDALPPDLEEK